MTINGFVYLFFGTLIIYMFVAFFFLFRDLLRKEERLKKKAEMKRRTIFHITTKESFEKNEVEELPYGPNPPIKCYRNGTLDSEGFIHCSKPSQLLLVAEKFKDTPNLLLLEIDQEKVIWPIRYEGSDNREFFPHIYGPINKTAIVAVHEFIPNEKGNFSLPDFPSNLK